MGEWRLIEINPKVWLITMLVACLLVQIPYNTHSGQPSSAVSSGILASQSYSSSPQGSTFYLTGNVTVKAGQNYTISHENLLVESLYDTTIHMKVYGNLSVTNSYISLDNVSYSKVLNFSIFMEPGSRFNLQNSTLLFPGAIAFNHSYARMENSTVNTSVSDSKNPYDSSLRISSNYSQISILSSTVNGLYRQNAPYQFRDGFQYLYNTPYSSTNSTIKMTPASHIRYKAHINSAVINVTYSSKYNESNNYLKIGYGGKLLEEYMLPFNLSEKQATQSFKLNFSGTEHNLTWMENSANFYLISVINSQTPITIYNLSEFFYSNDTVSLYGNSPYSYNFSNSNVTVFNSSIGVNDAENVLTSGQANPDKLFMNLNRSTLTIGDSSITGQGSYFDPFFQNHDSRIYFMSEINVNAYSHDIPVQNLQYGISPSGHENLAGKVFLNSINSTGSSWIYNGSDAVVYETANVSGDFNYTGTFSISSAGSISHFSVSPFPTLNRGPLNFTFTSLSIPYSSFNLSGFHVDANGTGKFYLQWAGNLSATANLNLSWTLYNASSTIMQGETIIGSPGTTGSKAVFINLTEHLEPGKYTLDAKAAIGEEHAFNNSGRVSSTYFLGILPPKEHMIRIVSNGGLDGKIWGISIGNTTFYNNDTSIYVNITVNETARIIEPNGYGSSPAILNLTPSQSQYNITFFMVQYEVSFENPNISGDSHWKLIIAGSTFVSDNSSITVALRPGTYNYEAVDPHGYELQNSTGIIHVQNSSFSVSLVSQKVIPLAAYIEDRLSTPEYYLPLAFAGIIAISIAGWNGSHTWYVCSGCGSTRKKKRIPCPYCGHKDVK